MCIGNRAEVSAHYVNAQLRGLYENAQHCAKKHLEGAKPDSSAVEYATCLAEFYAPARHSRHQQVPFSAKFDCPRIEFVCNHEVVLFLNIRDGKFILDTNKPTKNAHETIGVCSLAFRIPFISHPVEKFHCKPIGNAENYTSVLHILATEHAVFVPEHSSVTNFSHGSKKQEEDASPYSKEGKLTALTSHITKYYLPTLKRAGLHVVYSLPDFDNLTSTTAYIDYSVISTRALATDVLCGVRVEDINVYLRGLWLQAAGVVDDHRHGQSATNAGRSCLAEHRLASEDDVDDLNLHVFFGPLQVQPLCSREVVLYLDIQDIHAYYGGYTGEPVQQLKDWKIAFIVNVIYVQDERGSGKRIKLDFSSARLVEHLSSFGSQQFDVEIFTRIKRTLITRVKTTYISILQTSETTTTIFHRDPTIHTSGGGSDDEEETHEKDDFDINGCSCEEEGSCGHTGGIRWGVIQKRILHEMHLSEIDLVTALTQGSINEHYKVLWEAARHRLSYGGSTTTKSGVVVTQMQNWKNMQFMLEACLAEYVFVHQEHKDDVFFAASFLAPKVQLVVSRSAAHGSEERSVVFYIHMTKGQLKPLGTGKTLDPKAESYNFSHWRLAFEVDLKMVDASKDTTSSNILKRLGLNSPNGLKQLVLALKTAKLNLSLSSVPGLVDGTDYRTIRSRREALAYYIQTCYFPLLIHANHHVLYTLPQCVTTCTKQSLLTAPRFEIVPFTYATGKPHLQGLYGRYRAIFDRNTIVVMGMTRGRDFPKNCTLPRGINWVGGFGKDVPLGSVYLSRKTFLEGVILASLKRVNAQTTIVPTFSGIKDVRVDTHERTQARRWVLQFATWSEHPNKEDAECNWREVTKHTHADAGHLEFEWRNKELWRYEHEDDQRASGKYSVECFTHNVLTIPTSYSGKTLIQLKGVVKMQLKYECAGAPWSSEASVNWSANISLNSTSTGLQVSLHPARVVPEIRSTPFAQGAPGYDTHVQALAQLRAKFPEVIDLSGLLAEMRSELEGTWTGVQVQGFELCPARPVFNHCGDLVLDLIVRGTQITGSVQQKLNGKASTVSMNGSIVSGNGNGDANGGEHWFRQVVYKAGDAIGFNTQSPTLSRMSSADSAITTSSSASSTHTTSSTTSVVSEQTVTYEGTEESTVAITGAVAAVKGNGATTTNGNGKIGSDVRKHKTVA